MDHGDSSGLLISQKTLAKVRQVAPVAHRAGLFAFPLSFPVKLSPTGQLPQAEHMVVAILE
ncbi:hypothetical protein FCH33_06990 [Serratia fonticola]|jgi:hypothetical protein|uniref:hypothetical protein n=1 Tax=Serratia fonticola TaxID=47917 RepID=UPI001575B3CB|nr:hypothetical protein [Serratia fonticola]NTY86516.1 hypothetical protein [Serratia fonticola]NTZ12401.1 hypothetical protein [Serratia fonticola]